MIRLHSAVVIFFSSFFILFSGNNNGVSAVTIDIDWRVQSYADITAEVGDTIVFTWTGFHNVFINPAMNCGKGMSSVQVGDGTSPTSYTFTEADANTNVYFACHVGAHCAAGQHITVSVGEPAMIPCTICKDGTPISNPDGLIPIPEIGPVACGVVEAFFLPDDVNSDTCQLLQGVGSLCGCAIADNACNLCDVLGGSVPPSRVDVALPIGDGDFTCGILEAFTFSTDGASEECATLTEVVSDFCCNENFVPPNITCGVCNDGTAVDPTLASPIDLLSCAELEAAVDVLVEDATENCGFVQDAAGATCCPSITAAPTPSPTTAPTTAPTEDRCATVGGFCTNLLDCCSARCNPLSNVCLPAIPSPKMSLAEGRGGAGGGPTRGGRSSRLRQLGLRVRGG